MPYQYIADPNATCIHINFDTAGAAGLSQSRALETIEQSKVHSGPLVTWDGAGLEDPKKVFDGAGGKTNNLTTYLNKVSKLKKAATCVAVFSVEELKAENELDDVRQQIPRTLLNLQKSRVPGLALIFITKGPQAAEMVSRNKVTPASFHQRDGSGTSRLENLLTALEKRAPAGGGDSWAWADAAPDEIDNLSIGDVAEIVNRNYHQEPLRRLKAALSILQSSFLGRRHAAELLVAAAMARVNIVFLGPPGTAKSLMVRTFSQTMGVSTTPRPIRDEQDVIEKALQQAKARKAGQQVESVEKGRRMFEYLLTRYTTPEELFGPAHIDLMITAGMHGRMTHGLLPQAETAFLDEIFKANSAILNTLLSITNERLFYNLGQGFRVNLAFVVGASNETPAGDELGALFDRFPVRVPCRPVDSTMLKDVITRAHGFDCDREFKSQSGIKRVACLNDLRLMSKIVQAGVGGGTEAFGNSEFAESFVKMLMTLRQDYSVSDRTPVQILRICRALALLGSEGGNPPLEAAHLRAWGYVAPKFAGARDLQQFVKARILQLDSSNADLFDDV